MKNSLSTSPDAMGLTPREMKAVATRVRDLTAKLVQPSRENGSKKGHIPKAQAKK